MNAPNKEQFLTNVYIFQHKLLPLLPTASLLLSELLAGVVGYCFAKRIGQKWPQNFNWLYRNETSKYCKKCIVGFMRKGYENHGMEYG